MNLMVHIIENGNYLAQLSAPIQFVRNALKNFKSHLQEIKVLEVLFTLECDISSSLNAQS